MAMLADLPPDIRTPFGQSTAGIAGTLTLIVAEEFDRMADRLAAENKAVAGILREATALLPGLAGRIEEALESMTPSDLRVSSFQAVNDRLRGLLIEVHAALEERGTAEGQALVERIWAELEASTRRREVQLPGR
jgi:hypothetical protein